MARWGSLLGFLGVWALGLWLFLGNCKPTGVLNVSLHAHPRDVPFSMVWMLNIIQACDSQQPFLASEQDKSPRYALRAEMPVIPSCCLHAIILNPNSTGQRKSRCKMGQKKCIIQIDCFWDTLQQPSMIGLHSLTHGLCLEIGYPGYPQNFDGWSSSSPFKLP